MPDENAQAPADTARIQYGFWIVLSGFAVVLITLWLAVKIGQWKDVKEVSTILSAVTGVVGSLAGAFFGVHVGAAGKEKTEAELKDTRKDLLALAAKTPPEVATKALNLPQ